MRRLSGSLLAAVALLTACGSMRLPPAAAQDASPPPGWTGTWKLDAARSTAVDPWRDFSVTTELQGDAVVIVRRWTGSREGGTAMDSVRLVPGGPAATVRLEQWPDNRHLGAYLAGDGTKTVRAWWKDDGRTLATESTLVVSVQQGERPIRIYSEYRLSPGGDQLDLLELRSTRPSPLHYRFDRAE